MQLERVSPGRYILVDPRMLDWIAERIPYVGPDHNWHNRAAAVGVVVNGAIVAGMALLDHDRRHGNCEIAMAAESPRWATRETIRKLLAWPFDQLGCRRVTTIIAASNARAIKLNEGLGFLREGLLRRAIDGDDAVILGLLREDLPAWAVAPSPPSA